MCVCVKEKETELASVKGKKLRQIEAILFHGAQPSLPIETRGLNIGIAVAPAPFSAVDRLLGRSREDR